MKRYKRLTCSIAGNFGMTSKADRNSNKNSRVGSCMGDEMGNGVNILCIA